ncbi:unnamed protein product [Gongylonema pulchrum]|uniref:EGF-like domain-containing protein n=1 Tax=Gongylonema pulchrum TaxID=637853 RepID=A0A183DFY4_9BILA|nr:unnamed protein product [Gongylonema pulchrum]
MLKLNPCRTSRCENGATCKPTANYKNYTCICAQGFNGFYCDTDIDECSTDGNSCLNGGICTNTFGSYQCRCPDGYTGRNCENDHDDCLPSKGFRISCLNFPGSWRKANKGTKTGSLYPTNLGIVRARDI